MSHPEADSTPEPLPPASPAMAEKLRINRTGRLTSQQRRLALMVGIGALLFMLCPLSMLLQMTAVLLWGDAPVSTAGGIVFTGIGVFFLVVLLGLVGGNIHTFLGEALMRRPVRYARGVLEIRVTEGHRPELPFSYILGDYSFAPFVAPRDLPMRAGAPYLVYYAARSRLLLSMAALDAPDADQWQPEDSEAI